MPRTEAEVLKIALSRRAAGELSLTKLFAAFELVFRDDSEVVREAVWALGNRR